MDKKRFAQTARGQALLVLHEVLTEGAYSNIALNKALKQSTLSEKDKQLVTELVYGAVARKITLEWYLAHYIADRDKLESWVYELLLLSLYQLVYLDKIPAHAVVHEAVNLAKNGKGADKLVNAVLRKLTAGPLPDIASISRKNKRISVQYSVPVWLVKSLIEAYGEDRALAICESLLVRNKASVRVTDLSQKESLKAATGSQSSELAPTALIKPSGYFAGSSYFTDGLLTIQDESSQLVAPTLRLQGHEQVLDACAAPGGKTTHMASYLTTGQVIALDLYDHKLALIEQNAQRLKVADRVVTKRLDAIQIHTAFVPETFDAILVDAPCSGIGLMRRKPDIKYNKAVGDFESLQAIQLAILDSVCQTVKKGGIITYSTCTILPSENQEVVRLFLERHTDFEQVVLDHDCEDILVDGSILITPEQYQTDGFFISQFRRRP